MLIDYFLRILDLTHVNILLTFICHIYYFLAVYYDKKKEKRKISGLKQTLLKLFKKKKIII